MTRSDFCLFRKDHRKLVRASPVVQVRAWWPDLEGDVLGGVLPAGAQRGTAFLGALAVLRL